MLKCLGKDQNSQGYLGYCARCAVDDVALVMHRRCTMRTVCWP